MVYAARKASQNCVAGKALSRAIITTGRRNFWKPKRFAGDISRAATTDEVKDLRRKARDLKEVVAEQTLEIRLLKSHDLITSRALIVIKAANEFKDNSTAVNQLWQRDFIYLKVIGWG